MGVWSQRLARISRLAGPNPVLLARHRLRQRRGVHGDAARLAAPSGVDGIDRGPRRSSLHATIRLRIAHDFQRGDAMHLPSDDDTLKPAPRLSAAGGSSFRSQRVKRRRR